MFVYVIFPMLYSSSLLIGAESFIRFYERSIVCFYTVSELYLVLSIHLARSFDSSSVSLHRHNRLPLLCFSFANFFIVLYHVRNLWNNFSHLCGRCYSVWATKWRCSHHWVIGDASLILARWRKLPLGVSIGEIILEESWENSSSYWTNTQDFWSSVCCLGYRGFNASVVALEFDSTKDKQELYVSIYSQGYLGNI